MFTVDVKQQCNNNNNKETVLFFQFPFCPKFGVTKAHYSTFSFFSLSRIILHSRNNIPSGLSGGNFRSYKWTDSGEWMYKLHCGKLLWNTRITECWRYVLILLNMPEGSRFTTGRNLAQNKNRFRLQKASMKLYLTLLHSERPKLYGVLAILSALGLMILTMLR